MTTPIGETLREIYTLLLAAFGPQGWWPAETELEMMIGAVLTQNTNWANAETAIRNLKENGLISIKALSDMPAPVLAEYIKPAGYYNLKATRVKNLIALLDEKHGGDLNNLFSLDIDTLREELVSVRGIGLETADSMILYGAGKPLFVVDAYTHRIFWRHGIIGEEVGYHELQMLFMDNLPHEVELFKEYHALLVKTGKEFCRRKPLCLNCPLDSMRT
jgi:endonuclease-3 related protein